jgi:tRNA dimethylallyltransferase
MGLIVICGPTATGKSALALELAQRLNTVILSADSRQVYREFDIGTAKPTLEERQQITHHLIDICDPTETLTLADYQQQAQAAIAKGRGQAAEGNGERQDISMPSSASCRLPPAFPIPLLVGGTGLYIRSITQGLQIPRVPPQMGLRSQLQSLGQGQCYAFLQQVDSASAQKIHVNDQVRTLRALEVYYTTGKPMSAQQGEHPPDYPILQIGLDCLPSLSPSNLLDPLTHRIKRRTEQMIQAGFVDEVAYLCHKYGADLPLLNTLGYQEIKQHIAGEISLEDAKALTTLHTRQFAKRQRTWFRAEPKIEWFDCDDPKLMELVWERVQKFMADLKL